MRESYQLSAVSDQLKEKAKKLLIAGNIIRLSCMLIANLNTG
jgi:hypothetical protein